MNKKISNIFKGDKAIWVVFLLLCCISLVEVFSASSNLTYKSGSYVMPILKHSFTIVVGTIVAIALVNVECKYFKVATPVLIIVALVTLIWVLFAGESINGANRVIKVGGQTFQPSEIAKCAVILAEAQILSAMQTDNGASKRAFWYILAIALPLIALIFRENFSTAALLLGVVILMMIIGRVPFRQWGGLCGVLAGIGLLGLTAIMVVGDTEGKEDNSPMSGVFHRANTWRTRVLNFLDSEQVAANDYDLDKDGQVAHANIAIVSSGYWGRGPGNSVERDFLAQAYSDFIYAIIIEELGLGGAALVVGLYLILLFRTAIIASRCDNNFPAYLAMGLALMLVVQASFNMMVAVGLAPVTGQPLPLISKGGTSTIINCAYIGAILSVSRWAKRKKRDVSLAYNTEN